MRLIIGLVLLAAGLAAEIKVTDIDSIVRELTESTIDMSESFVKARTVIETYRQAPSCQRMALAELVKQSNSKATDVQNIEVLSQEIKELFATRLGLCELSSAATSSQPIGLKGCESMLPLPCAKFRPLAAFRRAPTTHNEVDQELCFPAVSRKQVQHCITSLRKQPQSWTSYSNALQNVGIVYQAVRAGREKDEILDTYREMMQMNQQLFEAYKTALQNGEEFSTSAQQMHTQFAEEVQTDLASVHSEVERQTASVRIAMARILGDLLAQGGQLGTAMEKLNEEATEAASSADSLLYTVMLADSQARKAAEKIRVVDGQVEYLHHNLSDVLNQTNTASMQMEGLVRSQVRQYQLMTEFTEQVEEKLAQLSWTGFGAINPTMAAIMVGISAMLTAVWPKALFVVGPMCALVILLHQAGVWVIQNLSGLIHLKSRSLPTVLPADWPSFHGAYIVIFLGIVSCVVAIAMLAKLLASIGPSKSSDPSMLPSASRPRGSTKGTPRVVSIKSEEYY